jgi:serine/threonine-protein kinase mTOR
MTPALSFFVLSLSFSYCLINVVLMNKRLAACLALKKFAIHAPAAFHSKTSQSTLGQGGSNEFLDHIFQAIRDPQPIVRACATDALSECLEIIVERRHPSLTGLLCQVHFSLMEGLQQDYYVSRKKTRPPWAMTQAEAASQHGSLLVVSSMLAYTRNFMLPRYEEVCRSVLAFTDCPRALIRLEVVRLIPRLARRSPRIFGRRYLEQALIFLIDVVESLTSSSSSTNLDIRPSAFMAIGELILAMTDETTGHLIGGSQLPTVEISNDPENPQWHRVELSQRGIIHEKLPEIFTLVRKGLEPALRNAPPGQQASLIRPALHCAANLVDALGDMALPYIPDLIDRMFRAGLSNDLIRCLHSIAQCIPAQQGEIEDRMLQAVSVCLAGVQDVYDPLGSFRSSVLLQTGGRTVYASFPRLDNVQAADAAAETPGVVINMDDDNDTVRSLVLSLQTLASFGGRMGRAVSAGTVVPLLPFVQDVVSRYLTHPSNEVRRAAALTCCMLLIPRDAAAATRPFGSYSGMLIEDVLSTLLRVAISDSSAIVRLCVVRALDSRYDSYLCQTHHLQELFLLLQDETLATKAASLQLLGRLAAINPAPILPVLRLFVNDLIVALQCGVDSGRGREEATRLLVVFLRAKSLSRLIHPLLSSVVSALPLEGAGTPPRLASAALEALGHLALATGIELQPWVNEVIPHVLEIMQDQSSASKQRTSLRTLGQIAGSTGYVIQPYLDYPKLLSHATDILPATKRAPWSLRREVIRTLGILGALDPDRYFAVASKTRKRGAVGGAYFEETDLPDERGGGPAVEQTTAKVLSTASELGRKRSRSEVPSYLGDGDDEQPASFFMYEQYSMVSQPVSSLPPAKKTTPADDEFYPTVVSVKRVVNTVLILTHSANKAFN